MLNQQKHDCIMACVLHVVTTPSIHILFPSGLAFGFAKDSYSTMDDLHTAKINNIHIGVRLQRGMLFGNQYQMNEKCVVKCKLFDTQKHF